MDVGKQGGTCRWEIDEGRALVDVCVCVCTCGDCRLHMLFRIAGYEPCLDVRNRLHGGVGLNR